MTNASEEPVEGANEADVVEQRQGVDGSDFIDEPDVSPAEADEADVLEQGANISTDDDAYPHLAEEGHE